MTNEISDLYRDFRKLAFTPRLQNNGAEAVEMLLMETSIAAGVYMLAAFEDGNTSIYTSSGAVLLGFGIDPTVARESKKWLHQSLAYLDKLQVVSEYPLPKASNTIFYLLMAGQVYSVEIPEADLGYHRSDFSPLFHQGQTVIEAVRLAKQTHGK